MDTEKALQLRRAYVAREIDLVEPYLVSYEVANALRKNPDFGVDDVKSAVLDLLNMQLDLQLLKEQRVQDATDVAFKYGGTLYDAIYISLAESEGLTLYTADDRLIAKTSSSFVKHVRDYAEL